MGESNPFDPFFEKIREIVAEEVAKAVKGSKDDRLLDIDEHCKILNVERAWIYHNSKKLPFTRKIGGNLRFSNNDLQRWIAAQRFQKRRLKSNICMIYIMVSPRKEILMTNRVTMLVYLDPDVRDRLKELAAEERVSVALLIRRAIDLYLKGQRRRAVRK